MHAKIQDVSDKKIKCSSPGCIKSKDGTMLMEKKEILNRWSGYVEDPFKDDRCKKPTVEKNTEGPSILKEKVKDLLMESYGANVKDCPNSMDCLSLHPIAMGSALTDSLNKRYFWFWALYNVPFNLLHPTDFGVLLQASGVDPAGWTVEQVWYGGQMFDSLGDIAQQYATGTLNKTKMTKPVYSDDLFSTLHRRGDPLPPNPQRPPMQVEPDGKRYSVKGRKVDYQGWSFYFRLSSFQGPQLYDVQFHGNRIAYELGLSEIAVYYSGISPFTQASDYIDSGVLSGLGTKALVPGGDCPETATLISYFVLNQHGPGVGKYDAAFCLFEHNNGYPLRRHLYYYKPDGFYSGMLDSVLTLRAALTVGNYDYIIDFIFHQNGALETRLMSTGYILGNMYKDVERLYGFQIEESLMGNLHHHMFHLKADLDVLGTSNRYETLNIERIDTHLSWNKSHPYTQSKFTSSLKQTEMEALYHFDFEHPKDHIVFNNAVRNRWGGQRAFRIHLSGMSKSLIPEDLSNEKAISWARNQIAVTKRKEEEFCSSSNYGIFDTLDPVVDFSTFYADDESIVDEDLVFWLTLGLHHIPHTEDLPVTPTAGNHLTAFILPYNYFPECPSMGSRDTVYIDYKDKADPTKGVKVERYGNSKEQCVIPRSDLEEKLEDNPDQVLESRRTLPTI
ncbi:amine oxidase [Plakobranchus ocellatus]|uniref:Amine oxidase n=1 Tax=Plakobranchus ocellatus TaxID=259542 RepID=A0AAV3YUV4_9GAST|nr:amine oxidase [Plakobranchus ocellatus]